jgi:hypothetical protein
VDADLPLLSLVAAQLLDAPLRALVVSAKSVTETAKTLNIGRATAYALLAVGKIATD